MLKFTIIQHDFRKENEMSLLQYALCDMIYHLSVYPGSAVPGWCYMSRPKMADELKVTKNTILNNLKWLYEKGYIIKSELSHLQTTKKWHKVYIRSGSQKIAPPVKNMPQGSQKIAPQGSQKIAPNKDILNKYTNNSLKQALKTPRRSIKNLPERMTKFIKSAKEKNEASENSLNPSDLQAFLDHWTEHNENGYVMRFEKQKTYNISSRLGTWQRNSQKWSKNQKNKTIKIDENYKPKDNTKRL